MQRIKTEHVNGHDEYHYDNGLVERQFEGVKNTRWWHKDKRHIQCELHWYPSINGWLWSVTNGMRTLAKYPEDQFEVAIARMLLE